MAYVDEVLADLPLLYWRLDETAGTTVTDISGNGRNGTYVGGPGLQMIGAVSDGSKSINLDGTTQYIERAAEDLLDFIGQLPFSLELWVRPTIVDTSYRRIVGHVQDTPTGEGYQIEHHITDGLYFRRAVNSVHYTIHSVTPFIKDSWNHLVATYDGRYMRMYQNGAPSDTTDSNVSLVNITKPFRVGADAGYTGADQFAGDVDEIAVYDHELKLERVEVHWRAAHEPYPLFPGKFK